MSTFKLTGGYQPLPEGDYVFKVTAAEFKNDFGKLIITMQTETGKKHTETFMLIDKNGQQNEGAFNAFSYFARNVMGDMTLEEVDEQDLVGHYVACTVEHEHYTSNKDGSDRIAERLKDYKPADGFEPRVDVPKRTAAPPQEEEDDELADLLGSF